MHEEGRGFGGPRKHEEARAIGGPSKVWLTEEARGTETRRSGGT